MNSFFGQGILRSLGIAFKNLARPNITVQYPHEKVELPERSRWGVEMNLDEAGNHRCTACQICERTCPDHVIAIDVKTNEDKTKTIEHWNYQLDACMMCGLCVEACPFGAIRMGKDYENGRKERADLSYDLLTDVPAVKPKPKKKPAATVTKGEGEDSDD